MRPNYEITHTILRLSSIISARLGEAGVSTLSKPSPVLREENELKSIYASLKLDFCPIEMVQLQKLMNHQKAIGDKEVILQGYNTIKLYKYFRSFDPRSKTSFQNAHKMLMAGLISDPGRLRFKNAIHVKGSVATHLAPPPHLVGFLMDELFSFIHKSEEIPIIKSTLFIYEILTIEPFSEGNGIMSRFWWKKILASEYPVFEFVPLEDLILKTNDDLIDSLTKSTRKGNPTAFMEYILFVLEQSIHSFFKQNEEIKTAEQRLEYFVSEMPKEFSRKDYMVTFENISTATASRDLKLGVEKGLLKREGDKRKTIYRPEKTRSFANFNG